MKRDNAFRSMITAPEGHTLLEFDFAGQEFRWMAVLSGDPTMLGLCQPGEDAHAYMGARIANRSYDRTREVLADPTHPQYQETKNQRQLGKVANLSLQYRTGPGSLVRVARANYGVVLTGAQAKAIHGTYRMTYLKVKDYWARQIRIARTEGWVETIAGRRVCVGLGSTWERESFVETVSGGDEIIHEAVDNKWGCESTAINFPIQGSGADQKYLALLVARNYLPTVEGKFYFEMHDGLFFVVPDRYAERAAAEMQPLLSNLPYRKAWDVYLPIQFPVDAKAGKSWGTLKEIKS